MRLANSSIVKDFHIFIQLDLILEEISLSVAKNLFNRLSLLSFQDSCLKIFQNASVLLN